MPSLFGKKTRILAYYLGANLIPVRINGVFIFRNSSNAANSKTLGMFSQGRNADGSPRNPKYQLDIAESDAFEIGRIDF